MLTYSHSHQQPAFATQYTSFMPSRPSPLAPRSANACPRPHLFDMSAKTPTRGEKAPSSTFDLVSGEDETQVQDLPYSRRTTKANPLLQRRPADGGREKRRGMFLRKVAESRDDKKWDARTDQILRSDYLAQQRAWEDERQRSDPNLVGDELYEMVEDDQQQPESVSMFSQAEPYNAPVFKQPPSFGRQHSIEDEAEAIAQAEQEDLMALMELNNNSRERPYQPSERYGSDDEDYNDLFMDFMVETTATPAQQHPTSSIQYPSNDVDMDMSGD